MTETPSTTDDTESGPLGLRQRMNTDPSLIEMSNRLDAAYEKLTRQNAESVDDLPGSASRGSTTTDASSETESDQESADDETIEADSALEAALHNEQARDFAETIIEADLGVDPSADLPPAALAELLEQTDTDVADADTIEDAVDALVDAADDVGALSSESEGESRENAVCACDYPAGGRSNWERQRQNASGASSTTCSCGSSHGGDRANYGAIPGTVDRSDYSQPADESEDYPAGGRSNWERQRQNAGTSSETESADASSPSRSPSITTNARALGSSTASERVASSLDAKARKQRVNAAREADPMIDTTEYDSDLERLEAGAEDGSLSVCERRRLNRLQTLSKDDE